MPKVKGPRESSDVLRENHLYKGYGKKRESYTENTSENPVW